MYILISIIQIFTLANNANNIVNNPPVLNVRYETRSVEKAKAVKPKKPFVYRRNEIFKKEMVFDSKSKTYKFYGKIALNADKDFLDYKQDKSGKYLLVPRVKVGKATAGYSMDFTYFQVYKKIKNNEYLLVFESSDSWRCFDFNYYMWTGETGYNIKVLSSDFGYLTYSYKKGSWYNGSAP